MRARYGKLPNDVDMDEYIDAVDHGLGGITLEEIDTEMAKHGCTPQRKPQTRRAG
jgi:hypothetical protein